MSAWDFVSDLGSSAVDVFVPEVVQEAASDLGSAAVDTFVPEAVQEIAADTWEAGGDLAGDVGAKMAPVDLMETVANGVSPFADAIVGTAEGVPGLGTAINMTQGVYHMGAGIYDGATGDRDGAVSHLVGGAVNMVGAGTGKLGGQLGALDSFAGIGGGIAKLFGAEEAPQSVADVASSAAVQLTNTLYGKDDSNWIAKGDGPTGSRRGEIGAGLGSIVDVMPGWGTLASMARVLDPNVNDQMGEVVGDMFGTPHSARTTGAGKPTTAQKDGQKMYEMWTGLFD